MITFQSDDLGFFGYMGWVLIYFLPTYIGSHRKINRWGTLFAANVILGWTGIFWVVCLIWSAYAPRAADPDAYAKERAKLDHEASKR